MANLFILKIRQSFFLWVIIFCCMLPFVILPFLNTMAGDDYILGNLCRHNGFIKIQQDIYLGWTGRFTATCLGSLLVKAGIVDRYYFFHSLLLFSLTWVAFFFLLTSINKHLLGKKVLRINLVMFSFILFFLNIYVQADIASGFYWFSSAMTYQTAFVLFVILSGCLINRFSFMQQGGWWRDVNIILLILLICGCNEIAAIFLIIFLLLLSIGSYYYQRTAFKMLLIYLAIAITIGLLIAFSSGVIWNRHNMMNSNTSYWSIIPMVAFRSVAVFYYILKEPLFWVVGFFLFVQGGRMAVSPIETGLLNIFKGKKILIPGVLIILLLVVGTLTPVLIVSKGSLPLRALNNLITLTAVCILFFFFLIGFCYTALVHTLPPIKIPSLIVIIIWACSLMANINYVEAWKSVFSGYFYHAVWKDRQQLMKQAKENGQRVVTIKPLEEALREKIQQVFPHGVLLTVNELLVEPPKTLFYLNEAENPAKTFLDYYELDKIIVDKR